MIAVECRTNGLTRERWTRLVSTSPQLSLMQLWEFGEARRADGYDVFRAEFALNGAVVGVAQGLVRNVPLIRRGAIWMNRGPIVLTEDPQGDVMTGILAALKRYLADERHNYLRIATPLFSTGGSREASLAACLGYRVTPTEGWGSARLDLRSELADLRRGMDQKWRNCLNKAERLGAIVTVSSDDMTFRSFLEAYRQFVTRKGFDTSVTPELLIRLQEALPPEQRMIVLNASSPDGRPYGGILIARYGLTGEYLAGAINDDGRAANAGHLLLWNAVIALKESAYSTFDVGGMVPGLTPRGILHFKEGLGGVPYRYVNEIEADGGGVISRIIASRVQRKRSIGKSTQ